MRWGRSLAIQLGVFIVLLATSALLLVHWPHDQPAASSTARGGTAVSVRTHQGASATPVALPQSSQAARRDATSTAAASTSATARISIARIGIQDAPVYDRGTDAKGVMLIAPGYAVTHYASSAPLGRGNTVLYGHDDIQGNIFGRLYDLVAGDVVEVSVAGQTQRYRVTGHQIVAPTAIGVLAPTGDVRLTIITCWPYNVDTKRWIVTAVKA
jgi:sortase A